MLAWQEGKHYIVSSPINKTEAITWGPCPGYQLNMSQYPLFIHRNVGTLILRPINVKYFGLSFIILYDKCYCWTISITNSKYICKHENNTLPVFFKFSNQLKVQAKNSNR